MRDWKKWSNRIIERGEGFYLIDDEGKKYLDGIASMWCNVWGHGQNEVVDAMVQELQNLQHSTLFGMANKPSVKLAERLIKLAKGMDKVFYTDNGSTAIEAALKMSLQYWKNRKKAKKSEFISLEHGYHGDTIGTMSMGYVKRFFGPYRSLLIKKVHRAPSPLLYGSKYEDEKQLVEYCLERTEEILKKNNHRCAALVMESGAQIAGGVIIYPPGYQKKVSDLCKKYNVLLILDEIATGFGRLGNMVEYLAQRSTPDIVCYGKALTAGYFPLAVTLTTDKIFDAFMGEYSENKQFYHGHTFTGHPIGCTAALANIELYEKHNLMQQIKANTKTIESKLKEFRNFSIVADIRHKGLLAGIELARTGKPIELLNDGQRINYFIMQESLKMGVFLRPLGNIILVIPPLAMSKKDLTKLMNTQLDLLMKIEKKS